MATEKIMEVKGGGQKLTLQELKSRIADYRTEIREYLDSHEASVEMYKFAVEKEGDGYSIEVAVKANIHPKNRSGISK